MTLKDTARRILVGPPTATAGTVAVIGGGDVAQVAGLPDSIAQAFGINVAGDRVSRFEAMGIPTVKRARNIIAGTIGTFPLVCTRTAGDGTVTRTPRPLLTQPDPNTTAQYVLTWTVDDLIFYGVAWWRVLARDLQGYPAQAERLDRSRVRLDYTTGSVYVDGAPVAARDLIRFDSPDEGVLNVPGTTLRTALLLEAAVRRFAVMDIPSGVLKDTRAEGANLTRTEVDELLAGWRSSRERYATGYLHRSLDYVPTAFNAQQLQLLEGRQHQALEIARMFGLAAGHVNAPEATGMTYRNGEAQRRALVDESLRDYMTAITQRLSLGDVTPRGQAVDFDLAKYLRGDKSEAIASAVAASGGPVLTTDEARADLLDLPPIDPADEPAPAPQETP